MNRFQETSPNQYPNANPVSLDVMHFSAQSAFARLRNRLQVWTLCFFLGGSLFIAMSAAAYLLTHSAVAGETADPARAVTYLEGRVRDWSDHRDCLSCHTGYSYGLLSARAKSEPTSTGKMIEEKILKRTASWSLGDSWYGHAGDQKWTQSRSTESVLNFVMLAQADLSRRSGVLRPETIKAFSLMLSMQNSAGSWDWLDYSLRPFEDSTGNYWGSSLLLFTLGSLPDDELAKLTLGPDAPYEAIQKIEKVRTFLTDARQSRKLDLHNRAALLLASTKDSKLLSDSQKSEIKKDLLASQRLDGSFSMIRLARFLSEPGVSSTNEASLAQSASENSIEGDGYATGFVTWVLRESGATASELAPGLAWLNSHQKADGSWPSGTMNSEEHDPTNQSQEFMITFRREIMTDLATAYALIALDSPIATVSLIPSTPPGVGGGDHTGPSDR